MSIKDQFIVRSIESSQTYEWFLHKHYAKRIPNISYSFGLYDRNKILKGVCSYAKPMSQTLVQGALGGKFTDTFLELNRLVVNDNLEKNTLSFFVSQSLMLLPKPQVVVSYADSSYHHHGYIYQATNWIYTGLSSKFTDYAVKGLEHMHHSSIEDSVGRYDKDKNIIYSDVRNNEDLNFSMYFPKALIIRCTSKLKLPFKSNFCHFFEVFSKKHSKKHKFKKKSILKN